MRCLPRVLSPEPVEAFERSLDVIRLKRGVPRLHLDVGVRATMPQLEILIALYEYLADSCRLGE